MTVEDKMRKATFKHVESELFAYKDTLKEIEQLRLNIMHCNESDDENIGGGRSSQPSAPTERIATRLMTNKQLGKLEEIAGAIRKVYTTAPDHHKSLIHLKYWDRPQRFTWDGIAEQLHVSKRQAMRWRDEVVYAICRELGWR